MDKRFTLHSGNKLLLNISPGYCCDTVSICEGYIVNKEVSKSLELLIWDDMAFNAYTKDGDAKCVEFGIDINHPLYFCVKRLLADDEQLIIDDDGTYEHMQKYMIIGRDDEAFKLKFVTNINVSEVARRKFGVFVKNIGPDARSKITDFSIKLRLVDFFRDVTRVLLEEDYQLNFDECLDIYNQEKKGKKVKSFNYVTVKKGE